jgi:hypothetical protein
MMRSHHQALYRHASPPTSANLWLLDHSVKARGILLQTGAPGRSRSCIRTLSPALDQTKTVIDERREQALRLVT